MSTTHLVGERKQINVSEACYLTLGFSLHLQSHSLPHTQKGANIPCQETYWVLNQVHRLSEGLRVLTLEDEDEQGLALPPPVALNTAGGSAAPSVPFVDLKTYL